MSAKSVRFVPPKIEFTALTLCILMEFSIHINIHAIDCLLQGPTGRSFFTCVALAKAGLVVGPLRPSVRPSVRSFVRSFVRPSVRNAFGVPSLCNL